MAPIPPWLNVSPSDFLRAAQAGASAGAQVAQIRNAAQLQREHMAQRVALAAAERADSAARSQAAMAMQQMQQQRLGQQAAAELAQQGALAEAGLGLRARDTELRRALEAGKETSRRSLEREKLGLGTARLEEQTRHAKAMEEVAASRLKERLGLPTRLRLFKSGSDIIAVDPVSGESSVVHDADEPGVRVSGVPVSMTEKLGTMSGLTTNPLIQQRLGTNLPPALIPSTAATESNRIRYVRNPETGKLELVR